jgi:hypothetical protein
MRPQAQKTPPPPWTAAFAKVSSTNSSKISCSNFIKDSFPLIRFDLFAHKILYFCIKQTFSLKQDNAATAKMRLLQ